MMKLEIRNFSSMDIANLWDWEPSSLEEVCFHLELEIGEKGSKGGQLFQLVVATPEGLKGIQSIRSRIM